jgi:hypothetical protein
VRRNTSKRRYQLRILGRIVFSRLVLLDSRKMLSSSSDVDSRVDVRTPYENTEETRPLIVSNILSASELKHVVS